MPQDRIWQLLSRKIDGEATMDELRELEQLLMNMPDDAYKIDIVSAYLQKQPSFDGFDEEDADAWEKHIGSMRGLYPDEFSGQQPPVNRQLSTANEQFPTANEQFPSAYEQFPSAYGQHATVNGQHPTVNGQHPTTDEPPLARKPRPLGQLAHHKAFVPVLISSIIITTLSFLFYRIQRPPASAGTVSPPLAAQTAPSHSSKTKMVLPDGTQVWLNGDSHLGYQQDFGKNNKREVVLTGEAFFDVTHNSNAPFVVHAKTIDIRVRGTAFNVKAWPEDKSVETSLLRGLVEVSTKADPKRKFILRPSEKMTIPAAADSEALKTLTTKAPPSRNKNQSKLYHIDNLLPEPSTSIIPEVAWLQDKLVFNNEPLSEIIEKMQRWYGPSITIAIKDEGLKDLKFTGAFSKETLQQALAALQATYPFESRMDNNTVTLYLKK